MMLRVWLTGAGALAVTIAGAAAFLQAGYFVGAMVFAVLSGMVLLFACVRLGGEHAGRSLIVGFCGLVVGVGAGIAGQEEVVLFGSSARDVLAADAPASGASFLHFRDARVLADRIGRADVIGGTQRQGDHLLYTLKVAPIVDGGWTEEQPIGVLAVIGSPQLGHRMAEWRVPMNGGVVLKGLHADEQAKAARDLANRERLTIAPDAVFVRWAADPEREAAAARRRLVTSYLIALGLWTVTIVGAAVMPARRPLPPPRRRS